MGRYSINYVASVITEDPDILTELDAPMDQSIEDPAVEITSDPVIAPEPESVAEPEIGGDKPLQAVEIEKQAGEIGIEEPAPEITDQIRAQEEAQLQMDQERQRLLAPQMADLRGSLGSLDSGITQGLADTKAGSAAFSGLNDHMSTINAILGKLEKQF